MRKKVISTCITAALMAFSTLTALPVNADSEPYVDILIRTEDIPAPAELLSFEELYALEEGELEQYCSAHGLKYTSKENAEEWLALRSGVWVNVNPGDYLLQGEDDVLESTDYSAFNRKNYYDYDFEKMTSDLKMPGKYYRFDAAKNDFSYSHTSENDAEGNPVETYRKYAAIYVEPAPSVTDEQSIVRLYQLIYVWTQQNPIVYGGTTMRSGTAPGSPAVDEELDTLGDINADGDINAVDASSVLAYYASTSTNQAGGYNDEQKLNADVNHDRLINAVDASNILAYYAYASTTKEEIMSMEKFMKK